MKSLLLKSNSFLTTVFDFVAYLAAGLVALRGDSAFLMFYVDFWPFAAGDLEVGSNLNPLVQTFEDWANVTS